MITLTLALLSLSPLSSPPKLLAPGAPAPKIEIRRWLKGEPITRFEPNKTYVVEFWASWCGPCLDSIPHVTELARHRPDVGFLGVGIWEDDGEDLTKFMRLLGDKMGYSIGYSGNKDGMAATWMAPAAQRGIPTAFIVKDRRIMWIGHPLSLDKPLEEIERGSFDLASFKKAFEQKAEKDRLQMSLDAEYSAILKLYDAGRRDKARKSLVDFVAKHGEYAEGAEMTRYGWLADENQGAWLAKTKEMLATGNAAEIQKVASFALRRAQTPAGAALARAAIGMVLEANVKNDYDFLVYGRSVYLKLGDVREALQVTNKMIDLFPKDPPKDFPIRKDLLLQSKAELEAKLGGR